jgi:hypothetical protein
VALPMGGWHALGPTVALIPLLLTVLLPTGVVGGCATTAAGNAPASALLQLSPNNTDLNLAALPMPQSGRLVAVGPGGDLYSANAWCSWRLVFPAGVAVSVYLTPFATEAAADVVWVYNAPGPDATAVLGGASSGIGPRGPFTARAGFLTIMFATDDSLPPSDPLAGFSVVWAAAAVAAPVFVAFPITPATSFARGSHAVDIGASQWL